jgi:hypothetical protein
MLHLKIQFNLLLYCCNHLLNFPSIVLLRISHYCCATVSCSYGTRGRRKRETEKKLDHARSRNSTIILSLLAMEDEGLITFPSPFRDLQKPPQDIAIACSSKSSKKKQNDIREDVIDTNTGQWHDELETTRHKKNMASTVLGWLHKLDYC